VRRHNRGLMSFLALTCFAACDNFGQYGGICDPAVGFTEDPWFTNAGLKPQSVWVGSTNGVWVGTNTCAIYRRNSQGGWDVELAGTCADAGFNTISGVADVPDFAVGFGGLAYRRNSSGAWSTWAGAPTSDIWTVMEPVAGEAWVAAGSNVGHWKESGGWQAPPSLPSNSFIQGVWAGTVDGGTPDDVYLAGFRSNGSQQTSLLWSQSNGVAGGDNLADAGNGQFESLWGNSNLLLSVGEDIGLGEDAICLFIYPGYWNCAQGYGPTSGHDYGVWGRPGLDYWVSGNGYVLSSPDGYTWSSVPLPGATGQTPELYRIAGSRSQVWAAGQTLMHCP